MERVYAALVQPHTGRIVLHLVVILGIPSSQLLGMYWMAATLAFILLFFVVGNSLRTGLLLFLGWRFDTHFKLGLVFLDSLISTLFTSSLTLALSYLWMLKDVGFVVIIVVVVSDLMALSRTPTPEALNPSRDETPWKARIGGLVPAGVCLVISLAVIAWRLAWFTWPESSGTDIFFHLSATAFLTEYGGHSNLFTGYPLGFHTIVSSIAIISQLDPYPILAYGTVVTYPISLILTYFLCETVSRSKLKSVMAVTVFPFVGATGALLGPQYMLPSTYAYTVGVLIMLTLSSMPLTRGVQSIAFLSFAVSVAVYPYMILGTLAAIAYFWSRRVKTHHVKSAVSLMIAVACLAAILFTLVYYLVIPFFGSESWTIRVGMLSFTVSPTLSLEAELLQHAYSPLQMALLVLGLVALAIYSLGLANQRNQSDFDRKGLLLLTTFYLAAFFLPVTTAYRIDMYNRPFIFLCIVEGAFFVVGMGRHVLALFVQWNPMKSSVTTPAVTLAVAALLIMSAYPTAIAVNEGMRWEPHSPRLEELQAFQWLRENTPQGGYILTDPTTGLIMDGFVLRNCSCSMITNRYFYTLTKPAYLWQQIYAFLNASSWDDTASYKNISSYMNGVSYIVISPRTSEWIWRQRNNNPIEFADYSLRLTVSDMAWAKFFGPGYLLVQQFGEVRILVKQEVSLYYFDSFGNLTGWEVTAGNLPTTDGQTAQWSNSAHPTTWYHLYANVPSFTSQQDLYLEVKWRANTTDLWGRVFGFSEKAAQGDYSFYTEEITPLLYWSRRTWKLADTPGYAEGPLESISLGFQNEDTNWTLYLDEIRIYGISQANSTAAEGTVEHNRDCASDLEAWNADVDRLPKRGYQAEQWLDSLRSAAIYQFQQPLEMKCISVSYGLGQYHLSYQSEFRLSNSFRSGVDYE